MARNLLLSLYRFVSRIILRARLRNRNFSIITETCIGGIIYHELGMQFLSPTINCWMEDPDFFKFIRNLKHYMACDLRFVDGIEDTPTAYCDDILIHFNHYKTNEEAAAKWYERRQRINWNNLFIITSDRPSANQSVSDEDILLLNEIPCKGKVVFSLRDIPNCDYLLKLNKDPNGDYVGRYMTDKNKFGIWKWERRFDYVGWLNDGKLK